MLSLRPLQICIHFALIGALIGCAPENNRPWQTERGYHVFSGRFSSVKSGNRLRLRGLSADIQLFAVALPSDPVAAKVAQVQLYNLLSGEEVICMVIPNPSVSPAVSGYCKVAGGPIVNRYMIKNKFAPIDCAEIRRVFGENERCAL